MKGLIATATVCAASWTAVPGSARAEAPPLSVYGMARLDFIVDDSTMSDAQQPFFVMSEADGDDTNAETSVHPRLSRIGLSVDEWRVAGELEGSGRIEVDFQNGGNESTPIMRLRHAYFALAFDDAVELLAGQTWDLMSPLFPAANNDSLMWNAGNTGDRRTQLRISALPGDAYRVAVSLGMAGAVDAKDMDEDGRLDGMESGVPMFQALAEYRKRVHGDSLLRLGLWGHVATEELADGTDYDSRSIGGHLLMPVTRRLTVLGEVFYGRNLSDVRGGIGQGVNMATGDEIRAWGGWLEAAYVTNERHLTAAGNTLDRAARSDLADGDREVNHTVYVVHRYRPHASLQLGLEYVHWTTRYKNADDGVANRFNVHMSMFF